MRKVFTFQLIFIFLILAIPTKAAFYSNDFEGTVGSEWSNTITGVTPGTVSHPSDGFLGQFNQEDVTLSLNNLPQHDKLKINFDLYFMDSWDGNVGGDGITVSVQSGDTLLNATFSNNDEVVNPIHNQSFPDSYGVGDYAPYTGALEIDQLGYTSYGYGDSVYRFSYLTEHDLNSLVLIFSGWPDQTIDDESWGIDNVSIDIIPEPATVSLLALGGLALLRKRK